MALKRGRYTTPMREVRTHGPASSTPVNPKSDCGSGRQRVALLQKVEAEDSRRSGHYPRVVPIRASATRAEEQSPMNGRSGESRKNGSKSTGSAGGLRRNFPGGRAKVGNPRQPDNWLPLRRAWKTTNWNFKTRWDRLVKRMADQFGERTRFAPGACCS